MLKDKTLSTVNADTNTPIAGQSPHILLVQHAGCYNRGCEAILRSTLQLLREYLPGCQLVASVYDFEADRKYLKDREPDLRLIPARPSVPQKYSWKWFKTGMKRRLLYDRVPDTVYANREEYERADIVLHIGGDNLIPSTTVSWSYLRELAFAKQLGAKSVAWACSINPCLESETARFAAALRTIDLITVRESETLEYLLDIGVTKNVVRVADPAFLLEPDTSNSALRSLNGKAYVGLGVSALVAIKRANKYSEYRGYLQANVGFARWLLANEEYDLVLVPHVTGKDDVNDDRIPCRAVYEALGDTSRVSILEANMNAAQMKGAISRFKYFIGARTHSTIASYTSFVPTISIGYSIKATGLNRDLLGTEEFLLDAKALSDSRLIETFKKLQARADDIRGKLEQTVPQSQALAKKNAAAVAELLHDVPCRKWRREYPKCQTD